MPPKTDEMPPAVAIVILLIWFLMLIGIVGGYAVIIVAFWRLMKAHEKLAQKIGEIAQKLQIK